jgi:DNA-binding IscR family transcriptional regulator
MLAPIPCASVNSYQKCDDCTDENSCAIRHAMIEVRNATSALLDNKPLSDMVKSQLQKSKKTEKPL